MKRPIARPAALVFGVLAAASALAISACDDGIGPAIWGNFPDTAELYSLARAEYVDRPGAYNILGGAIGPVVLERLGPNVPVGPYSFDFALSETEEGEFVILPLGYFPGAPTSAGIQRDTTATFEGLRRAPRDGYITTEPVPAETGLYVVRSRQNNNGCYYYGKVEILELDPDGIATIQALANVNCSDRSLVPNAPVEDDDEEEAGGEG